MTRITKRQPASFTAAKMLLISASALAIASVPAQAAEVLFASNGMTEVSLGQQITNTAGVLQIRLDNGATLSFTEGAQFTLNADGSIDLAAGSVTIAGAGTGQTVIHMADGAQGTVGGTGNAASFSIGDQGQSSGHTFTGSATIERGRTVRDFPEGQMWASSGSSGIRRTIAQAPQITPPAASSGAQAANLSAGGPVAAAQNGLPVSLGDALAAAGASSDVVTAARNVDAANGNPHLESYPVGDLALLVALAGDLQGTYGGTPFPAAQADIIRTYLGFLADGGSGANFLTAYAGFLTQYLDLIRTGGLPSNFGGAGLADINAFLAYQGNLGALANLSAQDQALAQAYLSFLQTGGNGDQFAAQFTSLINAYFAFVRGGGNPLEFTGASQATVDAYIAFLSQSGLAAQLTADNQALIDAYLASGGFNFAAQYAAALDAYFTFLLQGNLPSQYASENDGLNTAAIQTYLEALQASGLFDQLLGQQAGFYADYLAFLQGGGDPDLFTGLPNVDLAPFADALNAYAAFLASGGLPSNYDADALATLTAYLRTISNFGQQDALLGDNSTLLSAYFAYLATGANADLFAGLPVYGNYSVALQAYYDFLIAGGLPADYTALTQQQIADYLAALSSAGGFAGQLGNLSDFYTAYFAYLSTGGDPAQFSGLPIYADYVAALNAYYTFLANGGLPQDYTALSLDLVEQYLAALSAAGGFGAYGNLNAFFSAYYSFVAGGGDPADFAGLPVYADYLTAISQFYAFLAGGGLPSEYTTLSQDAIEAYLQALADAGLLAANFNGDLLVFYTDYLAFLTGGGMGDNFGGLPMVGLPVPESGVYAGGFLGGLAETRVAAAAGGDFSPTETFFTEINSLSSNAVIANNGVVNSFFSGADVSRGTARSYEVFGDSEILIGRWSDGTYIQGTADITLSANQGYHYVLGRPLDPGFNLLARDSIRYSIESATLPTIVDGSLAPGVFSGDIAIMFNSSALRFGIDAQAVFQTDAGDWIVSMLTPGGLDNTAGYLAAEGNSAVSRFGIFNISGNIGSDNMGVCPVSGCVAYINGQFSSTSTDRLGLTYAVGPSFGHPSTVVGAAILGEASDTGGGGTYTGPFDAAQALLGFAYGGAFSSGFQGNGFGQVSQQLTDYSLDTNGGLLDYTLFPSGVTESNGTTTLVDVYDSADALIGRWSDGVDVFERTYNVNNGLHYLAVRRLPAGFTLPASGRIDYYLTAATAPTFGDGASAPGVFEADLAILLGASRKIALEGQITMPGNGTPYIFNFASQGGIANSAQSTTPFGLTPLGDFAGNVAGTANSGVCATTGNCFINFAGAFAGDQDTIGLVYQTGGETNAMIISGAAIFESGAPRTDTGGGTGGGGTGGGGTTSNFTGTRDPIVYYTYTNGSLASGFGGSATLVNGQLTGFTSILGTISSGNASIVEAGDLGDLAWARWTGGTVTDNGIFGNLTFPLTANGGYHVMAGNASASLPASGRVDYSLVGTTAATDNQGSAPGTISGDLAIQFGAVSRVGYELAMNVGGRGYAVATTGGVANPGSSQINLVLGSGGPTFGGAFNSIIAGSVTGTGGACVSSCQVSIGGALYGANGVHAGVAMNVIDGSSGTVVQASGLAIFSAAPGAAGSVPGNSSAGGTTLSAMAPADWDRWEVSSDAINMGADMAITAPGIDALAARGIQFSADQLAQLEAFYASRNPAN